MTSLDVKSLYLRVVTLMVFVWCVAAFAVNRRKTLYEASVAKLQALEPRFRLLNGSSSSQKESALSIIEQLASAYSTLHLREKSSDLYWKALLIRQHLKLSTASASVALASELQYMGRYEDAIAVVTNETRKKQLTPGVESVLLRQEAQLLDCQGKSFAALQKTMRAKNLDKKSGSSGSIADLIQFLRLLRKVLIAETVSKSIPPAIHERLIKEWEDMKRYVIDSGTFNDPLQMPKSLVRGLRTQPWHSFEETSKPLAFSEYAPLISLLEERSQNLLSEFRLLDTQNLLEREEECIHDSKYGSWRVFMCNAHWFERVDERGCSLSSPIACSIMQHAQDTLMRMGSLSKVLRVGYSAVSGQAHLHAHCGNTNAQIKLHLALFAPINRESGIPCARIRVANETRFWKTGKVFVFDDSFEHEVWNACDQDQVANNDAQRVVFQLVISHPEMKEEDGPWLSAEREEL